MHDLDEMGPVDYIVVEFPGGKVTGQGFRLLVDLVDRDIIRVLDLVFVAKGADGSTSVVAVEDLDGDGDLDLVVFDGASSGLLGPDDIATAGEVVAPGSTAALLVYENAWAAPLAVALRHGGAQLVASGSIPIQAILAELDASDGEASQRTTILGKG